jgi:hypothetical protein
MKKNEYVVRGFLLSQHMMPFVKIISKTKSHAISLAEVLLEDKFHYVSITNSIDDEIIEFKKELVWER